MLIDAQVKHSGKYFFTYLHIFLKSCFYQFFNNLKDGISNNPNDYCLHIIH